MNEYTYDEIWGYEYERIREYLLSQSAAADGDTYVLDSCTVVLDAMPDREVGGMAFPQTRVRIKGSGADEFHHRFKLRFLKGGA